MRTKTPQEVVQKVQNIVRRCLAERYKDEFVFDPIIVQPRLDHDGDEYLDIWIVYDGDYEKLDTHWNGGLTGLIFEEVTDDELPVFPSRNFVPRPEWEKIYEPEYRKTGIVR